MDNRRLFLAALAVLVAFLIYRAWMQDYGPKPASPAAQTKAATTNVPPATATVAEIPQAPGAASLSAASASHTKSRSAAVAAAEPVTVTGELVRVHTDLFEAVINAAGGDLEQVALEKYPAELHTRARVKVLDDTPAESLVAQSGLQTHAGPQGPAADALYSASQTSYALAPGQHSLDVALAWRGPDGFTVKKIFTFTRGSYRVGLRYEVTNDTPQAWTGAQYFQFRNHYNINLPHGALGYLFNVHRYDYQRVAMYAKAGGYEQHEFKDLRDKPVDVTTPGGWTSVVSLYFLAAVIPGEAGTQAATAENLYYTRALGNEHYLIGTITGLRRVAPGASTSFADTLYLGPKLQALLPTVAPDLQLTVDYGKFTIIAEPLFALLGWLHRLIGNWGWAIILLTVLVKIVFFPLNHIAYRSMAKTRAVQPKLKALQQRYKEDKQKLAQAQMEFYKKEKINPLGGCLPMIIQIPIFFALYYVLVYSVELRQQPWILWIHDLSAPDPYFILPILYGAIYFVQMRIQPQMMTDKTQRMIFQFMPLLFVVFYALFPSGLVLYYLPNSMFTVIQQWFVNRRYDEHQRAAREAKRKPAKNSR
ncbi:MAG: membrane protein insertase YidC [Gammaproteobacteria bacterium]